jgi:acetylornithine deacetylase/succinyl-diaminopimelate desuccinylase-like protein
MTAAPRRRVQVLAFAALALACRPAPPVLAELSEPARWLQEYLRIDTTNPPGHEERAVEFLRARLAAAGIASERLVGPGGRSSLVARLPPSRPGGRSIVLLHHMDVVPAGEGWSRDAFGGEERDGSIWGRGAIDCKSLGIAELAAFLAAARSPAPRERGLILLAVADEETGGGGGTGWILDARPELFSDVEAVLNEGGQNRVVLGKQHFWGLETTQKRPLWLEIRAAGRAGHASAVNPESAVHQLVRGLARLVDEPAVWRVSPAARAYFAGLAPIDANAAAMARDLDAIIQAKGPTRNLLPGMAIYFLDTVQVTVLEGASEINVVPGEARARVDVRLLPDTDEKTFLDHLRAVVGKELEVEVLLSSPPVAPSPTDTAVYRRIAATLSPSAPVVPSFIAGITDSRYFRARGIAAYGFSPFALDWDALHTVHGPDEHIPVAAFDRGVETLRAVVLALVTDTSPARLENRR